jgi:hypothetical protein
VKYLHTHPRHLKGYTFQDMAEVAYAGEIIDEREERLARAEGAG